MARSLVRILNQSAVNIFRIEYFWSASDHHPMLGFLVSYKDAGVVPTPLLNCFVLLQRDGLMRRSIYGLYKSKMSRMVCDNEEHLFLKFK